MVYTDCAVTQISTSFNTLQLHGLYVKLQCSFGNTSNIIASAFRDRELQQLLF